MYFFSNFFFEATSFYADTILSLSRFKIDADERETCYSIKENGKLITA